MDITDEKRNLFEKFTSLEALYSRIVAYDEYLRSVSSRRVQQNMPSFLRDEKLDAYFEPWKVPCWYYRDVDMSEREEINQRIEEVREKCELHWTQLESYERKYADQTLMAVREENSRAILDHFQGLSVEEIEELKAKGEWYIDSEWLRERIGVKFA